MFTKVLLHAPEDYRVRRSISVDGIAGNQERVVQEKLVDDWDTAQGKDAED